MSPQNSPARRGNGSARRGNGSRSAQMTEQPEEHWTPLADIFESDAEIMVVADMPGVDPSQMDLSVSDNELNLSGMRTIRMADNQEHRIEFRRTIEVGPGINADKVKADMNAGVLTVHLPKASSRKQHRIEVKSSTQRQ